MKTQIKVEDVMKVYSGINHKCMCGCYGTYKVASAHRTLAELNRGCDYNDDQVSDRSVKILVGKINRAIAEGVAADPSISSCPQYLSVVIGGRILVAYFVEYAKAKLAAEFPPHK